MVENLAACTQDLKILGQEQLALSRLYGAEREMAIFLTGVLQKGHSAYLGRGKSVSPFFPPQP
jgi:hypothetical protein